MWPLLSFAPFKPHNKDLTYPNFYLLVRGFLFRQWVGCVRVSLPFSGGRGAGALLLLFLLLCRNSLASFSSVHAYPLLPNFFVLFNVKERTSERMVTLGHNKLLPQECKKIQTSLGSEPYCNLHTQHTLQG